MKPCCAVVFTLWVFLLPRSRGRLFGLFGFLRIKKYMSDKIFDMCAYMWMSAVFGFWKKLLNFLRLVRVSRFYGSLYQQVCMHGLLSLEKNFFVLPSHFWFKHHTIMRPWSRFYIYTIDQNLSKHPHIHGFEYYFSKIIPRTNFTPTMNHEVALLLQPISPQSKNLMVKITSLTKNKSWKPKNPNICIIIIA